MRPSSIVVEDQSQLPVVFSTWLKERLVSAVSEHGRASLALTGGSVADSFFPHIAQLDLDWSKVHFFWGDERAVPPDSSDSNFRAAQRLLFEPAQVPAACIHRMPADEGPLPEAADRYARMLTEQLGEPPKLDVALLGVGPDGHVCSLFPGHRLLEDPRWVADLSDSPKPPPERLTLTLGTLREARAIALAALGSSKSRVVRELLAAREAILPAARVLQTATSSVLFLDTQAAAASVEAGILPST